MLADVPDLIDRLSEAAIIPELWPGVIERFGDLVGSHDGALWTISCNSMRYVATARCDTGFKAYVTQRDFHLNVRPGRALAQRHHGFLRDVDLCTLDELAVDPVYEKYLRPHGFGWTVGTVIPVPGGDMLAFEIVRRSELGPFEAEAVARLDACRPHLARSAHLAARLGLARAHTAASALAAVGLPAAVLREDGRVLATNDPFEALAPRIETAARDRLAIADADADRLMQEALGRPSADHSRIVRSIPVRASQDGPPLILHLNAVRRAAHDIFVQAGWIVVVTPIVSGTAPDASLLQGLFDLTAAEARVARNLLEGATAGAIATNSGVSINTVRSQIQSVLAKTGVSRQTDLVGLLSGAILRGR